MADVPGLNATVTIDDTADSARAITAHVENTDLDMVLGNAETSAFGDNSQTFIYTMQGRTFSIDGNYNTESLTGSDTVLGAHAVDTTPLAEIDISFSPDGGTITYAGKALLTSYKINASATGKVSFSASFTGTGNWTRT